MTSKKTLNFETTVAAPCARVWSCMLGPEGYRAWTAVFSEGSTYVGSWEQGTKMRFVGPSGDGMSAEIAENRRHEFISIRHLGMIENGVEDLTSDKVRAWAPAYENYRFEAVPGGCRLVVSLDTAQDWEQYMLDTYPKALAVLKQLCEQPGT
ncbi:SRPBCC domain-containing protein [Pelomonas sp. SE-A7]|uniref:SRPBCC family protein n=1 Tax=Pelomonas sp. SE-A7 TaxID=3054953 RepID=UPI00259CF4B3|nr:SRPBCC domain-containing protein [Pelomonas sp. SE-A7]MDM4766606.1 SRPBCC domain-containing protein [Pelomonas sp. SE-A7]